jgi:hypothetical protein
MGVVQRIFAAILACSLLLGGAVARAQDKFADCPDPEAARNYVKQCRNENPYATQEACEERALERFCSAKK